MNTYELRNCIIDKFNFLVSLHGFVIARNEPHWLGGVLIEYKSDQYYISILYDKRESWFVIKLYSALNQNKTHLYIIQEIGKIHQLSNSPIVQLDNDIKIKSFLSEISEILKQHYREVIDSFNTGHYYGG